MYDHEIHGGGFASVYGGFYALLSRVEVVDGRLPRCMFPPILTSGGRKQLGIVGT